MTTSDTADGEDDAPAILDPQHDALALDREAEHDEPRPGVWAGEPASDLRLLTQDETDVLIRLELLAVAPRHERAELIRAFGDPSTRWGLEGVARAASVQRGGLDSDPLVRVLARRAWGDRDRRWLADRGVRTDDRIVVIAPAVGVRTVAMAWPGEIFLGFAQGDARPGERVRCKMLGGDATLFRVSDRVRVAPLPPPPPEVDPARPERRLGSRRLAGLPPRATSATPRSRRDT